jgi:hypothetical protein
LPGDLEAAIKQLDDKQLDRLVSAVLEERTRRKKPFMPDKSSAECQSRFFSLAAREVEWSSGSIQGGSSAYLIPPAWCLLMRPLADQTARALAELSDSLNGVALVIVLLTAWFPQHDPWFES